MVKKTRNIGLVLYEDNKIHMDALEFIKHNYQYYIYIKHDKDFDENNKHKKNHFHVLLYFPNQKLISALLNDLKVAENCVYIIRSLTSQLRYLIHLDDEDKFQYDVNNVIGSRYMILKFNKAIKNLTNESEEISLLLDYIDSCENLKIIDLLQYSIDNDIYSTFRRNYSILKDILYKL